MPEERIFVAGVMLIVLGTAGIALDAAAVAGGFFISRDWPEEQRNQHLQNVSYNGIHGVISLPVVAGGIAAIRRRCYPLAVTGAVICALPCVGPTYFFVFPAGIWILFMFIRHRQVFHSTP